ncbi:sulfatase [Pandoraea terrae]|uniref:Sulfatase n=1 Tax=Pandoraea terrae TaxID=1537710 RepID=A0A5E4YPW8_9BURK|nr:SUMF1/EgtB/PvdO family nonheme iron enzyme [Pandoraea terrae]VVE49983.1 sulfatase [Pandoraea terrae]
MWRKLLVVSMLGMTSILPAEAEGVAFPAGDTVAPTVQPAPAQRVALVIGNARYTDAPLPNAPADARAIGSELTALGFDVMLRENVTQDGMASALAEFRRRLEPGGVGLFYYAGHGMQVGAGTVLIPIDATGAAPSRLLTAGIDLQTVLASMPAARPGKVNLVILDTCLNNPYRSGTQPPAAAPEQTLIAYGTSPGSLSGDGTHHGVFTAALLDAFATPGLDVETAIRRAAAVVSLRTQQRQVPSLLSSLSAPLPLLAAPHSQPVASLAASDGVAPQSRSRGILPKNSDEAYELEFWESIKNSNYASDYEAYLKAYPNGRFAPLARARIERLRSATPKAGEPPTGNAHPAPMPAPGAAPSAPAKPAPATLPAPATAPAHPAAAGTGAAASAGRSSSEFRDCPACPVLISLPRGSFTMGSNVSDPTEKPPHPVTIAQAFAIGKYEVTVEQWNACADAGGCQRIATNAANARNAPARDISWDDAQQYVAWLSKTSGKTYRLPTEAEWEYAARGGTTTLFWWGDQMRKGMANCKDCGDPWRFEAPDDVGSFAANPFGLHDVNGSVWEWVGDCWHNSYKNAPADGRAWNEPNCSMRVIRGGSWREGASYMASSTRFKYNASVRQSQNGFRVVRDLK